MHAGMTTFQVQPGKMGEAVRTYLGSVVPAMRKQQGFRGVLVLTDPETEDGHAITLWETEADAVAFESSGTYREQVAKLGGLLAEPPARSVYEVSIQM